MNKLVKLPLFLGICGAACAGVLAGVNAVTAPIIEQAKIDAANAAYIELFKDFSVTSDHITTEDVSLSEAGCTVRAIVVNDNVKGIAYTCSVKGYAGPGSINFQIGFANGKYHGYVDLGNTESKTGIIPLMNATIKGIDANEALMSNAKFQAAYAGTTVSATAIAAAVEVCRTDYLAWYSAQ